MFLVNGSSRWEYSGVNSIKQVGRQGWSQELSHTTILQMMKLTVIKRSHILLLRSTFISQCSAFSIYISDLEIWLYSAEKCTREQKHDSFWLSASNKLKLDFLGFCIIAWMLFNCAVLLEQIFGISLIWLCSAQYKTGLKWKNMLFLNPHFLPGEKMKSFALRVTTTTFSNFLSSSWELSCQHHCLF